MTPPADAPAMQAFLARFGDKLAYNVPTARYTAARMGGTADYLYVARDGTPHDIAELIMAAWQAELPVRVIGGGANVLIADSGVRGLLVVNHLADAQFGDWGNGRNVRVSSGTSLQVLARWCAARGIGGMEWAIGVPGTVGGAIVNNAGAHGDDMAACVVDITLADMQRGIHTLTNAELEYAYRHSALKARQDKRFFILEAHLRLPQRDKASIQTKMDEFTAYRKRTQPSGASMGSIFKNPAGDFAGRLLESAGMKGYRVGGAQVSTVHANFILNVGACTASDYYTLITHMRDAVQAKHGIALELEIELLGAWG